MHLGVDQQDFIVDTSKTETTKHPIFSVTIKGLDNYPAILAHHKLHYHDLLMISGLLSDHPRKGDKDALAAVKCLKPFWSAGDEFYDWFEKQDTKKKRRS